MATLIRAVWFCIVSGLFITCIWGGGVVRLYANTPDDAFNLALTLVRLYSDQKSIHDVVRQQAVLQAMNANPSRSMSLIQAVSNPQKKQSTIFMIQQVARTLTDTSPPMAIAFCNQSDPYTDHCFESVAPLLFIKNKMEPAVEAINQIKKNVIKNRLLDDWIADYPGMAPIQWEPLLSKLNLDGLVVTQLTALRFASRGQWAMALNSIATLPPDKKNLMLQKIGLSQVLAGSVPEGLATIRSIPNKSMRLMGFEKAAIILINRNQFDEAKSIQTTYLTSDSLPILQALAIQYTIIGDAAASDDILARIQSPSLKTLTDIVLESAKLGDIQRAVFIMNQLPNTDASIRVAKQLGELAGLQSDLMFQMMHMGTLRPYFKKPVMETFALAYARHHKEYDRVINRLNPTVIDAIMPELINQAIEADAMDQLSSMQPIFSDSTKQQRLVHMVIQALITSNRPTQAWVNQLTASTEPDLKLSEYLVRAKLAIKSGQSNAGSWLDKAESLIEKAGDPPYKTGLLQICEIRKLIPSEKTLGCYANLPISDQVVFLLNLPEWVNRFERSNWLRFYEPN